MGDLIQEEGARIVDGKRMNSRIVARGADAGIWRRIKSYYGACRRICGQRTGRYQFVRRMC